MMETKMLPDWDLWACAMCVDRQYGPEAQRYIARQLNEVNDSAAALANWGMIAACIDLLHAPRYAIS